MSALTPLTDDYWNAYHTYRLEWMPGKEGYLAWYLGEHFVLSGEGGEGRD